MEPALPAALYDFIYKDASRIASYYAQMFQGHLIGTERTTANKDMKDSSGKINVGIAGGDIKVAEETLESLKEIIDPHDRAVNDVLTFLHETGRVEEDLAKARHNSVVMVRGTLLFLDRFMLEVASSAIDVMIQQERSKPKQQQDASLMNSFAMMKKLFPKMALPSSFLLTVNEEYRVVGTLKDEGMQEPITSYYFKHGMGGLGDIYLLGINERASVPSEVPATALVDVAQQAAQALSTMVFPTDAYRVTPLALFRTL
jgi:hypothetical protein